MTPTYSLWQIISYLRGPLLFVFNFHPEASFEGYIIGVEEAGEYQVSDNISPELLVPEFIVFFCFFLYVGYLKYSLHLYVIVITYINIVEHGLFGFLSM